MTLISIQELTKRYGDLTVLDHLSVTMSGGEIFGLLGPNGAGKTTLLRILATLLTPTSGRVTVAGFDTQTQSHMVRQQVGVVNGGMGLPAQLTGREILRSFAGFYNMGHAETEERIAYLDESLELGRTLDIRASEYSTGMRQKIVIARSVIHDPSVLILDEAASGLDIFARRTLLDWVLASRMPHRLTLYSTHVMSEAEEVCDRVAILHKGTFLTVDSIENIKQQTAEKSLERAFFQLLTQQRGAR